MNKVHSPMQVIVSRKPMAAKQLHSNLTNSSTKQKLGSQESDSSPQILPMAAIGIQASEM